MIIIVAKTLIIYKKEGETPLECLERFRLENPNYKDTVLSYAGRLDPMAEGVLLVLIGDENKKREEYLGLDKTYEVEILFDISTDTGDILGIPTPGTHSSFSAGNLARGSGNAEKEELWKGVENNLKNFIGTFTQKYPAYSSKTVKGKPLFKWARENKLQEIEIPEKTSRIYDIELMNHFDMTGKKILSQIKERIEKVNGDFRQFEIQTAWEKVLKEKENEIFDGIKIKVKCSSGTYMRTLAEEIAKKQNTSGIAWRIKRLLIHEKHQTDIDNFK
ncbi:MAG: hypothetical protein M3Q80_02475 [bacterium]|nr:hypothetical protein [bacterium]